MESESRVSRMIADTDALLFWGNSQFLRSLLTNVGITTTNHPQTGCRDRYRLVPTVATLFICILRYVSDLLEQHYGSPEERFWKQVRATIVNYQDRFPQLETRFETFDLFKQEFTKLCLNRNRILDYGYNDYITHPKVTGHGTVSNALHSVSSD